MSRYVRTESLAVPSICRWLLPAHSTLSGNLVRSIIVVILNVAETAEFIRVGVDLLLIVRAKIISWCALECTAYMKLVWSPMV